jgi:4-hydroxybenzoate polyprenyltransferase
VASLALPDGRWPGPAVIAASALVGVAAHLTNGVKDLDADAVTGIRGLPQRLGLRNATLLSAACVLAAVAVLGLARPGWATGGMGLLAVALAGLAAVLALHGRSARLFELSMAAAAPVVIAVVMTGGVR